MDGILPFLTAALGAAATYLIARRKTSGSIRSSEAETLWNKAERMREELEKQSRECKREVAKLELDVFRLRIENHSLRNDMLKLLFDDHPEVPDVLKEDLIERNNRHIQDLQNTYEELKRKVSEDI